MTTCASCGKEIRDNDWTCGSCGAAVSGATAGAAQNASTAGYTSSYAPPAAYGAPAAAPTARPGLSRSTLTIIMVAAVFVVAIIAVWFFFLRGGSSPFDGTWNAGSSGLGAIVISGSGDDFKVKTTTTDASGAEKSSVVPAHLDGADLVITVDDFVKATGDQAQAAQVKAIFEALIQDFRLVFSLQDSTHLKLTVEGTPTSGQSPPQGQSSIVLVKAQ
jgi:hypothetical protein